MKSIDQFILHPKIISLLLKPLLPLPSKLVKKYLTYDDNYQTNLSLSSDAWPMAKSEGCSNAPDSKDNNETRSAMKTSSILGLCALICVGCTPDQAVNIANQPWKDDKGAANATFIEVDDGQQNQANTDADALATDKSDDRESNTVQSVAILKAQASIARSHNSLNDAQAIEESLRNSYARKAANRADICPKLVQRELDTNVIRRVNDIMIDNYCDYFLYPQPGQNIQVTSNNNQLELLLIAPELYDFANGAYLVTSAQKHVIRLQYDGAAHRPKEISYDVEIIIDN